METYVAERPQTVDAAVEPLDRSGAVAEQPKAAEVPVPPRDEWRWIPDPADADLPPVQRGDRGSSIVVRALAWVSLQYRA